MQSIFQKTSALNALNALKGNKMSINPTSKLPLVERVIIQLSEDYHYGKPNKQDAINFIENNIGSEKLAEYLEGIDYD